jgi:hypothetical protein
MKHREQRTRRRGLDARFAAAAAGTLFLLSCSAPPEEPPTESVSSELVLGSTFIDNYRTQCPGQTNTGFRCQVADIADVGPDKFVIGYIDPNGTLKYSYRSTTAGVVVAPFAKGTNARWVRANTSKSWSAWGCNSNFFAVEVTDPEAGHGVYLDSFFDCGQGGWSMSRTFVGSGTEGQMFPAVATKGTPYWGDLLFSWNGSGKLYRYRYMGAQGWTAQFPFNVTKLTSDLIYHAHSNRWIHSTFGFGGLSYSVFNILYSSDDDALPESVGYNDLGFSSEDGHHTCVAYNPLGDGSYVWWRHSGTNGKALHVYGPDGVQLSSPVPFPTNETNLDPPSTAHAYTIPVTQTYSPTVPYVFLMSTGLYGLGSDQTWKLLDETRPLGNPLAVRSLQTDTVGLVGSGGKLNLVTSDYPATSALVSAESGGNVDLFYNSSTPESLHNSWQTSWGGAGAFAAGYPIGEARAKELAVGVNADGLQEVFHVGDDYVVRHARERVGGGDSFEDLGMLGGSVTRAKQIAVQKNDDGTLTLFFTRYPDDVLSFTRQTVQSTLSWSAPAPLVGATTKARRIAVASAPEGKIQLVYTTTADVLTHTSQTATNANTWTPPALVGSANGAALELLLTKESGQTLPKLLYVTPPSPPTNVRWLAEANQSALGTWTTTLVSPAGAKQISAGLNQFSQLHVVFVGPDDGLYQTIKQTSGWSGAYPVVSPTPKVKRVAVTRNPSDWRLEVFYLGLDDVVYHTVQVAGQSSSFHPPSPLQQEANLAVGRYSNQSTDPFGAVAARANDGNTDGNYWAESVNHTDWGFVTYEPNWPGQYWYVDLGSERMIGAVNIYNRTDCCTERLSHYNVLAWKWGEGWSLIEDRSWEDTTGDAVIHVPFTPLRTQWVMIAKTDNNYLHLAEVEVMGF